MESRRYPILGTQIPHTIHLYQAPVINYHDRRVHQSGSSPYLAAQAASLPWFEVYGEDRFFIIMYSDGPLETDVASVDLALAPCLGSRAKRPPGTEAEVSIPPTQYSALAESASAVSHGYVVRNVISTIITLLTPRP